MVIIQMNKTLCTSEIRWHSNFGKSSIYLLVCLFVFYLFIVLYIYFFVYGLILFGCLLSYYL